MRTEELMQNDWVRLSAAPIFCRVRSILDDGTVKGVTVSGGQFSQHIRNISAVELVQDIILRTGFWLKSKDIYKKTVRGIAAFTYDAKNRRLSVVNYCTGGNVNIHDVAFLHELQQQFRHYTYQELVVDLASNKRKEYGQRYYGKKEA